MDSDATRFRQALGAYPTGVAVVTTALPGGDAAAITINSFASVSLRPCLLLWSLGDQSDAYEIFSTAELWGVSVLGAEDGALAALYAANGRPPVAAADLRPLGGAPVLARALAAFGCRTHERRVMGDHLLIVGEARDFSVRTGPALSFFRGHFGAAGEAL
ncbi:MAG: flavin reductase family protein [Hyphomonadaceae bacterium]